MTRMPVRRPQRRPVRHERRYWDRRTPRRVPSGRVTQYHRIELALSRANSVLTKLEQGPEGIRRLAMKRTWGKDWQKARRIYMKLGKELDIIKRLQRAIPGLRLPNVLEERLNEALKDIHERIEDNRQLLKLAALNQDSFRKKVRTKLKLRYSWTILVDSKGNDGVFFRDSAKGIWFTDARPVGDRFPHLKRLILTGTRNIRTDNPFIDVPGEDTIIIPFTKVANLPGRGRTYNIRRKGESV